MIIRRIAYYLQFVLILAMTLWMWIAWGIYSGGGLSFLGVLITVPITLVALAINAFVSNLRHSVRRDRAISWLDVVLGVCWWVALALIVPRFGDPDAYRAFDALVTSIFLGVVVFAVHVIEAIREAQRRVRDAVAQFESDARMGVVTVDMTDSSGAHRYAAEVDGTEWVKPQNG